MSYRLAVLVDPFPQYSEIYGSRPGLAEGSHAEQKRALDRLPPASQYPYLRYMPPIGVDVEVFYPNAHALHRAWAAEHAVAIDWNGPGAQASAALVLGELAEYRPDVLLVHSPRWLQDDFLAATKEYVPSLRATVAFEGGLIRASSLRHFDLVLVGYPTQLAEARDLGLRAELVYHTFDPDIADALGPVGPEEPLFDFTFAGSSGYGMGVHHNPRYWALVELLLRTPLHAWLQEIAIYDREQLPTADGAARAAAEARKLLETMTPADALRTLTERFAAPDRQPPFPLASVFQQRCRSALYGLDLFRLLRRSRVTFNQHHTFVRGAVGNSRLFEATGIGTCLLTDAGSNLAELFEPDREVVVYHSTEEAVEKLRWLLDHESERRAIADAGRRRALEQHSFGKRCERMDQAIRRIL